MLKRTIQGASVGMLLAFTLLAGCGSEPVAQESPTAPNIATPIPAQPDSPPATETDPLADTQAVPGERVGPVTEQTSREELAQLFGEENLTDEEINIGEGFTEPGTRVDLGDRSFTVIWADATRTEALEVRNFGSAWETPEGIHVGMPFSELQDKLGAFELYGFAWDYGGTVALEGTPLAEYEEMLILRVHPNQNAAQTAPDDYQAVIGDVLYASTNPHMEALEPKVGEMIVRFGALEQ